MGSTPNSSRPSSMEPLCWRSSSARKKLAARFKISFGALKFSVILLEFLDPAPTLRS
jgi:hypothetical protein